MAGGEAQEHRGEAGFTVLELIVAAAIALVVLAVSLDLLGVVGRRQNDTRERAEATAQIQTGVARLMRELHQAAAFNFINSQVIDINTWVRSGSGTAAMVRVRYDCSVASECRRYEAAVGDPLPARYTVLATGIANPDVFEPKPAFINPTYIGVNLHVGVGVGKRPIVVNDGTELPNAS
jgi:type II secretory pathway pseudopilin PulG